MIKTITVESWEDFIERLKPITDFQKEHPKGVFPALFRGQSNAEFKLETTLERNDQNKMRITDYYRLIGQSTPTAEALSGSRWEMPEHPEIDKYFSDFELFGGRHGPLPATEFLVYLRHHGFPSPLLDWSASPYVAAYFAFRDNYKRSYVSIYTLEESKHQLYSSDRPLLRRIGPFIRTHKRHFLQQADYTLSAIFNIDDGGWRFASHEIPISEEREDYWNFRVTKFNIPASERLKLLRQLDAHNLNAFSLFGSEDSLMETLAMRYLHFPDTI